MAESPKQLSTLKKSSAPVLRIVGQTATAPDQEQLDVQKDVQLDVQKDIQKVTPKTQSNRSKSNSRFVLMMTAFCDDLERNIEIIKGS